MVVNGLARVADPAFQPVGLSGSYVCAIHQVAPRAHCGCAIIGHGEEADGQMYC
jgi:hypothetical protein